MKFEPRLPDDRVNVTPGHPLREAALMAGAALGIGAGLVLGIGGIVDLAVPHVPPRWEMRVFELPILELLARNQGTSDAHAPQVSGLLERLARRWPERPYAFRLAVRADRDPNAFAVPGAWVVLTSGLLAEVESENELAFVLGHELGHFRNRDHLRGLGRGIAVPLAQVALGLGGGGSAGNLASFGGHLAGRAFDRDQESDADRFGLELVAAEYGHVAGARDFFQRMAGGDSPRDRAAGYLSTHPLHEDRVANLRAWAAAEGWSEAGPLVPLRE